MAAMLVAVVILVVWHPWKSHEPVAHEIPSAFARLGLTVAPDALVGHRPGTVADYGFDSLPDGTPVYSTLVVFRSAALARAASQRSFGPTVRNGVVVLYESVSDSARIRRELSLATRRLRATH